jgi:predicted ATPase
MNDGIGGDPRREELSVLSAIGIRNFKSFDTALLDLSELTLLIGANASGKSNALEALHLLSWMATGQRLGLVQSGVTERKLDIRGVASDLRWNPDQPLELACRVAADASAKSLLFKICLDIDHPGLRIVEEELRSPELPGEIPLYRVVEPAPPHGREMLVEYNNFARGRNKPRIHCVDEQPVFTQLTTPSRFGASHKTSQVEIPAACRRLRDALEQILFLDPQPRAMRGYAFREQPRLTGDGSNLSGVLHELVSKRQLGEQLLSFVRDLPEQDITDIGFVDAARGDVMLRLQESFGGHERWQEAVLLSDGTLRVLAVAAALYSVEPGSMVVIEEIDNGVHPTRAGQLLDRIRSVALKRRLRILLTTHNPALLDALPEAAVPDVVCCYRDPGTGASRLVTLRNLAGYSELVARGPLGRLVTQGIVDRFLKAPPQDEDARRAQQLDWVTSHLGR